MLSLATYLKRFKVSGRRFAQEHGVSPSLVSQWLSGETLPSLEKAIELERRTGIAVQSWKRRRS